MVTIVRLCFGWLWWECSNIQKHMHKARRHHIWHDKRIKTNLADRRTRCVWFCFWYIANLKGSIYHSLLFYFPTPNIKSIGRIVDLNYYDVLAFCIFVCVRCFSLFLFRLFRRVFYVEIIITDENWN